MKRFNIIIVLLICLFYFPKINALTPPEEYNFIYTVYYDPVNESNCNASNYWTFYNSNTTCYRFVIVKYADDFVSEEEDNDITIILDHNIAISDFNTYEKDLKEATKNWKNKDNIDILAESDTFTGVDKVELKDGKPTATGLNGLDSLYMINSLYYNKGIKTDVGGFWLKGEFSQDNSYAYIINSNGEKTLAKKSEKRGIRPVIAVPKSKLNKEIVLEDNLSDKKIKEYSYETDSFAENSPYEQNVFISQSSFTITKDRMYLYYNVSVGNSDYKILASYGENYKNILKHTKFTKEKEGITDLTYNIKDNKIIAVDYADTNKIIEYNPETLEPGDSYKLPDNINIISITYDNINNYYIGYGQDKVYIIDIKNNKILYTFDQATRASYRTKAYHNGYLYTIDDYVPSFMETSGRVYAKEINVYNVKINQDGTPNKNFGKLVQRINFDDSYISLDFYENNMYLATTNTIQVINDKEIEIPINYEVSATGTKENYTIYIKTNDELKNVDGWILSNDKTSLSKTFNNSKNNINIDLCDYYNNCTEVSINTEEYLENLSSENDPNPNPGGNQEEGNQGEQGNVGNEENPEEDNPYTGAVIPTILILILTFSFVVAKYELKKYKNKFYHI